MAKHIPSACVNGQDPSLPPKENDDQSESPEFDQASDLVWILHQALFSNSNAQHAVAAAKAAALGVGDPVEATNLSRIAIGAFLESVHSCGLSALDVGNLRDSITELLDLKRALFGNHFKDLLDILKPHGELVRRYREDHPSEKKAIADYICRTFLAQGPSRCFLQGSTAAIHLGQAIAGAAIPATSLFYTNSVMFPVAALRPNAHYSVYTFCGPTYDPVCGGWLFPPGDRTTAGMLRRLFDRQDEALKTAYLMPLVVSPLGTYYQREETALLCRILIENAKELIILATPDRLRIAEDEVGDLKHDEVGQWAKLGKPVSLVVAGESDRQEEFTHRFAAEGVNVHWGSLSTSEWRWQQTQRNS